MRFMISVSQMLVIQCKILFYHLIYFIYMYYNAYLFILGKKVQVIDERLTRTTKIRSELSWWCVTGLRADNHKVLDLVSDMASNIISYET